MDNQNNANWYEQPVGVAVLLIFLFPVGLYIMWKKELWTQQTRWIITVLLALTVIGYAGDKKNTSTDDSTTYEDTSSSDEESTDASSKVSFADADAFMQARLKELGHAFIDRREKIIEGETYYLFLSVPQNGYLCVSTMSEYELKVIASDCNLYDIKMAQWREL